jgi:hypothetical protein
MTWRRWAHRVNLNQYCLIPTFGVFQLDVVISRLVTPKREPILKYRTISLVGSHSYQNWNWILTAILFVSRFWDLWSVPMAGSLYIVISRALLSGLYNTGRYLHNLQPWVGCNVFINRTNCKSGYFYLVCIFYKNSELEV